MKINTNPRKNEEVLTKRVAEIIPDKRGLADLIAKRRIRLYLGVDPTGANLHLGHTVPLRKLQEFANLGHEAILIVGTGTVLTGDPSLREGARARITEKEIRENIKTWKKQVGRVIDLSRVKIKYNGDWLLRLGLREIVNIASHISAVKLFQREMFQRRIKNKETVWTHETLYPLLQGYDSVYLETDLEIGGTDQIFNMLIGRELLKKMRGREKFVMSVEMALGTDGKPMSKSSGNCIWLEDSPQEMFGKVMSIPDHLIISYFKLFTGLEFPLIADFEKKLKTGKVNPSFLKRRLGREIIGDYYSEKSAQEAEREFDRVFKGKNPPSEIPEVIIRERSLSILDLLVETGLAPSRLGAKRLVSQGGVSINEKAVGDWKAEIKIKGGEVVRAGKRRFVRIKTV